METDAEKQAEFERLRIHYFVGQAVQTSKMIGVGRNGAPRYQMVHQEKARTDSGDLELDEWESRASAAIDKYGEQDIFQQLLCEYTRRCGWLHSAKERKRYALDLHMSRIFENPDWAGYEEFYGIANGEKTNKEEIKVKGTLDAVIEAITEMQPEEQNAVWMVGEQLKDMLRGEPELAEVVYQDLERKGMELASCEKEIKKYADAHKTGNFACVPPQVAEGIIREFYGLPGREAVAAQPARKAATAGDICLNLEDFI